MKVFIEGLFELAAVLFDKVPVLNKLKGYRTVLGFVGLGVVKLLALKGVLSDPTTITMIEAGLMGWTVLAVNAKGRTE
jgi:uncharacterized membrane protein